MCTNRDYRQEILDLFSVKNAPVQEVKEKKSTLSKRLSLPEQNIYGIEHNKYANYLKKLNKNQYKLFSPGNLYTHFTVRMMDYCKQSDKKSILPDYFRSCRVFKSALKQASPESLILMIDFLFLSDQTFFDKLKLSPSIFTSMAIPSIFQDAMSWKNGCYSPAKKLAKMQKMKPLTFDGEVDCGVKWK